MLHARKDYNDRIQDSAGIIPADEPVFLIRSCDQAGHLAIRAWAHIHRINGGSDHTYNLAMDHADKMEQWGKIHGTKAADTPQQDPELENLHCERILPVEGIIYEDEKVNPM